MDKLRGTDKKRLSAVILLLIALPLLLIVVKQRTDNRSRAAAPDQLEAEGGVLGGNAVAKADSLASGGQYVEFSKQTGAAGPRPAPSSLGSYVYPASVSWKPTAGTTYTMPIGANQSAQDNFISSVPNGTENNPSIIVFPAGNTWTRNGNGFQVRYPRAYLIFWGYGAKLNMTTTDFAGSPDRGGGYQSGFMLSDYGPYAATVGPVHHIKILGLEIIGSNPDAASPNARSSLGQEYQAGVTINGWTEDIEIADSHVRDTLGDSINVFGGADYNKAYRYNLHNNLFERNGRSGVILSVGDDAYIENNIIRDSAWASFGSEDAANNQLTIRGMYIRDNLLERDWWTGAQLPGYLPFTAYFSNSYHNRPNALGVWKDFYFERNTYTGRRPGGWGGPGDTVHDTAYIWIGDRYSSASEDIPIDGCYIRDNQFIVPAEARFKTAVMMRGCRSGAVTGNNFSGAPMDIQRSSVTVSGNN